MKQDKLSVLAKRLVHLYLLKVEIPEPYPRIISRLFEFLDFDDSKDIRNSEEFICDKFNEKGEKICYLKEDFFDMRVIFGARYTNLLRDMYWEGILKLEGVWGSLFGLEDFVNPFILCILRYKGIKVDKIHVEGF